MTRSEAFTTVCHCLRARLLDGAPCPDLDNPDWQLLIAASSYHLVTPALAWCLKDRPEIPSEIAEYLGAALALNGGRNERLLAGTERIVAALNLAGVPPMLIKGVARLAEGLYPLPALRILGDLDIMVPSDRLNDASAALSKAGFAFAKGDEIDPDKHHLPVLHEHGTGIGVEIHSRILLFDAIIPTAWVWERARLTQFRNQPVYLPDATCTVGHNVAHNQIQDFNFEQHRIALRQLLDFAMLRARHEADIDWGELDRRFCAAGYGQVLATYAEFANRLFGQSPPRLREPPSADACRRFYRGIERPNVGRWKRLVEMVWLYCTARRRDPSGFLELFKPGTWAKRVQFLKSLIRASW